MNKHTVISLDLAKSVFQACNIDTRNQQVRSNKTLRRNQVLDYMRRQPPCRVFMEACGGAHYWARQLHAMGHEVHLMAPQFVTPFRKGHKTDANDALAIAEAGQRPNMRFVPIKSLEQQGIQSLHRVREVCIRQRTQLINQTHGLLQEYGVASGRGQKSLRQSVWRALEDADNELTVLMRELLTEQMIELARLNGRIDALDKRVERMSRSVAACRALLALEGVGPVGATMLYSALGNGHAFSKGRQASAYLGLTPRQYSSGGEVTLTGIGRTGQPQLKATLIRGAHAVLKSLGDKQDAKSRWLRALVSRTGKNRAAVALANKTVRTAWAMLHHGQAYQKEWISTPT